MSMTPTRTRDPWLAGAVSWLVLGASFGLSAATWVALAELAGFTGTAGPLRLAWLMPLAIDGYVVVSLATWMSPVPERVARFARTNTYAAAAIGVAAQSSYHALAIYSDTSVMWRAVLAAVVGALPPAVAAFAIHMRALIRRHSDRDVSAPVAPGPADTAPDIRQRPAEVFVTQAPPSDTEPEASDTADERGPSVFLDHRRAAEVARALKAADPDMTPAAIGLYVGRSAKQVSRYLRAGDDSSPISPGPVNGSRVHELEAVAAGHRADD